MYKMSTNQANIPNNNKSSKVTATNS